MSPQSPACPECTMTEIISHAKVWECATCGHEWEKTAAELGEGAPAEDGPRVVKDANGCFLRVNQAWTGFVMGAGTLRGPDPREMALSDCVVIWGTNAVATQVNVMTHAIAARKERGAKIVVIDPRRTASAEEADLFLPVAPGMDSVIFAALLVAVVERGATDASYISQHTSGFDEAVASARLLAPDVETAARKSGLEPAALAQFIDLWIATDKTVTSWSQGVNQSAQGTDKVDAIIHCHLASGRIGKEGAGPPWWTLTLCTLRACGA